MTEKMSRWGIGPVFAVSSIAYGVIMQVISRYVDPAFPGNFLFGQWGSLFGIALLLSGICLFIVSVVTVTRAYNADHLVTDGIFRCCRHPLYASWVIFIIPGAVLLWFKTLLAMTTPVFMYVLLRRLVKKEEIYLESVFGREYAEYKARTPCILPYGLIKGDKAL